MTTVEIEGSSSEEEPQGQEAPVQEQPTLDVPSAEEGTPESPEVQMDLKVDDTPKKSVDDFFETDYDRIVNEVVQNGGQFTEEHYAEFEANGHSRALADRLLAAEVASAEARTNKVVQAVGGQELAQKALQWAAENLTESQKVAINSQLSSTDVEVSTLALQSLIAQSGAGQTMVQASTMPSDAGSYFETESDFTDAMSDTKRMQDPTYRAMVMRKLDRSISMGIINGSTK
jgi:hypothetical protein